MNKKIIIALFSIFIIILIFFIFNSNSPKIELENKVIVQEEILKAEQIEVVHFHGTQQCFSCKAVGEYALKTIKERFSEEYENGIITFKEINGELIENKDIVMKYEARGSSLFINAITSKGEDIKEDVTVWRLVSDENQFLDYFENKLKKLLGKN